MSDFEKQQVLERLARAGDAGPKEVSMLVSPGGMAVAWAVKVESNFAYNVYNVRAVTIGGPGMLPDEIGDEMEAVNLAEDFLQAGQLASGTYVVMHRVGDRNVFYAPV